jgi:hypothetical protein
MRNAHRPRALEDLEEDLRKLDKLRRGKIRVELI